MADTTKKDTLMNLNVTVVALVALVALVGVVAIVLNGGASRTGPAAAATVGADTNVAGQARSGPLHQDTGWGLSGGVSGGCNNDGDCPGSLGCCKANKQCGTVSSYGNCV